MSGKNVTMTGNNITLSEVKASQDVKAVVEVIEEALKAVKEAKHAANCICLIKIDGRVMRFSTYLENALDMVGSLELIKHDIIKRMYAEEQEGGSNVE